MSYKSRNVREAVTRKFYSVNEKAAVYGVSPSLIRKLIKDGKIPHIRVGERILIPIEATSPPAA